MEKNDAYWDNLIAAYLDGTASAAEVQSLLRAVRTDPTIREMMDVLTRVDEAEAEAYPMYRMAAETKDNLCDFRCELFILRQRQMAIDEDALLSLARKNEWVQPSGG